jgi:hypothetical protein
MDLPNEARSAERLPEQRPGQRRRRARDEGVREARRGAGPGLPPAAARAPAVRPGDDGLRSPGLRARARRAPTGAGSRGRRSRRSHLRRGQAELRARPGCLHLRGPHAEQGHRQTQPVGRRSFVKAPSPLTLSLSLSLHQSHEYVRTDSHLFARVSPTCFCSLFVLLSLSPPHSTPPLYRHPFAVLITQHLTFLSIFVASRSSQSIELARPRANPCFLTVNPNYRYYQPARQYYLLFVGGTTYGDGFFELVVAFS